MTGKAGWREGCLTPRRLHHDTLVDERLCRPFPFLASGGVVVDIEPPPPQPTWITGKPLSTAGFESIFNMLHVAGHHMILQAIGTGLEEIINASADAIEESVPGAHVLFNLA